MIRAENIRLTYGSFVVLEQVNFEIKKGQAAVLLGSNGSGKSTLLLALAGVIRPKEGHIEVSGRLAYVPQGISLIEELTFQDNLRFFASLCGCTVPETLPFGTDVLRKKKIKAMSGGMKKICSIVCALLGEPEILLLDEPCASLDAEHRRMVHDHLKVLRKKGVTIVYIGHDEAEYQDFADLYLRIEGTGIQAEKRGG